MKAFAPSSRFITSNTSQRVVEPAKTTVDNRPSSVMQRKLQDHITNSPRTTIQRQQAVIQRYWLKNPGMTKPVWKDGQIPKELIELEEKYKNQPVYGTPGLQAALQQEKDTKAAEEKRVKDEKERQAIVEINKYALDGKHRKNSELTAEEKAYLRSLPRYVSREDDDFESPISRYSKSRKAHLVAEGLVTPGNVDLGAFNQLDQLSTTKQSGDRVSTKMPVDGPEDRSNSYGGKMLYIKVRKLEKARLKHKRDAQNLSFHDSRTLHAEVEKNPVPEGTKKTKVVIHNFIRIDREAHIRARPHSVEDRRNIIKNRFLVRPGDPMSSNGTDSDSDDDNS